MTVTKAKAENTSTEWATPKELFDALDDRFEFTLDPCASVENAKCEKFYTKEDNGLAHSWKGERVFVNPPYGKEAPLWVEKAWKESHEHGVLVACLVVPRTDTNWFHRFAPYAEDIAFLKGRVKFEDPSGNRSSPQDPSCILVFDQFRNPNGPRLHFWDWKNNGFPMHYRFDEEHA